MKTRHCEICDQEIVHDSHGVYLCNDCIEELDEDFGQDDPEDDFFHEVSRSRSRRGS